MKRHINRLRLFLIGKLLTEDENYLLCRAIEERVDKISELCVTSKYCDSDNLKKDIYDYSIIKYALKIKLNGIWS